MRKKQKAQVIARTPMVVFAAALSLLTVFAAPAQGQARLSPAKLVFYCLAGQCRGQRTATVTNVGNTTVRISSLTLSSPDFTLSTDCGKPLMPGQSCTITIGVIPSPGSYVGTLTVNMANYPSLVADLEAIVKS